MISLWVSLWMSASGNAQLSPRVVVEALDERSRPAPGLAIAVRGAVAAQGAFSPLSEKDNAKVLDETQNRWLNAMAGPRRACELKAEARFAYVLRAKVNGLTQKKELALTLLSGEVSCVLATVTVPYEPTRAADATLAAINALVLKLPKAAEAFVEEGPNLALPPEMVRVPAGEFLRGCNEAVDSNCDRHESPSAKINLAAFDIDSTEVTVAGYARCVEAGGCSPVLIFSPTCNWGVEGKQQHPVNCVTWQQAKDYCAHVGKRLPTEAEWEKAARGVDGRLYPWGNQPATCREAVMDEKAGNGCGHGAGTWRVGSKPGGASPYGALDMAGNVAEWVADWYDGSYYQSAPRQHPNGPTQGAMRVFRGGGYFNQASELRASHRERNEPGMRNGALGFRCARSAP